MSANDVEVEAKEEVKDELSSNESNELNELRAQFEEFKTQSNKKSELIRKLNNQIKDLKEKPKETTEDIKLPEASDVEKRIKEREIALEQKHQKRAKLHGISEALENAGLKKDMARRFAKLIEMEEGDNLQTALDDFDDYTLVGYKTSDGEVISTSKWMKEYLNSEKGVSFKPIAKGPTPPISRDGQRSNSDRKKISSIEYSKLTSTMSREERNALADKYEIID